MVISLKKTALLCTVALSVVLSACAVTSSKDTEKATDIPQKTDVKEKEIKKGQIEISKDNDGLVLATAQVDDLASLELVMKSGTYSYDHYSYEAKHSGEFYLQYYKENTMVSERKIEGVSGDSQAEFHAYFHIEMEDYNKDGNPDFLIGQDMSDVGTYYRMYSIVDQKIVQLDLGTKENMIYAYSNQPTYEWKKSGKDAWEYEEYDRDKGLRKIKLKWSGDRFKIVERGNFVKS